MASNRNVASVLLGLGLALIGTRVHAAPGYGKDRVKEPYPVGSGSVTSQTQPGGPSSDASTNADADPTPQPTPEPLTPPSAADPAAPPTAAVPEPIGTETNPAQEEGDQTEAEELRRSGAHLRPPRELELLREHRVAGGKIVYVPGDGLLVQSANRRFALATRLRAQFRYTAAAGPGGRDAGHSLQIRRARIVFAGYFWNEHNQFKTELAFSPRDMRVTDGHPTLTPILDWYLDFTYLRDLSVRIGQYKVPFNRQRVISSGDLQLVDRSIANAEFTLDRDIGIDLRSTDLFGLGLLRYYAGVYMGEGRDNFQTSGFELFYLARVEVLPFGLFNDYQEVDFRRSLRPRLSLGAAYAFVDGAQRNRGVLGSVPTDGGTTDYHVTTADVMFKYGGLFVFADGFYRQGKRKFGDATVEDDEGNIVLAERESSRDGYGWSAQTGYLLPRTSLELAARYAQIRPVRDGSSAPSADTVGGGLGYYFAGHSLKLQTDYFAHFETLSGRPNHELRIQLQAAF